MNAQLPPKPPQRFQVRAGVKDGQPIIELVDNLAMVQVAMPLPVALEMAAGINHAAVALMHQAQVAAKRGKKGIVTADGRPL
jgi:hypothetical protein